MLPPTSLACLVSIKCDLMLDRLSNNQFLAVPALDAPIIAPSHYLRIVGEAVRSQLVFVSWKRLQRDTVTRTPP